MSRSIRRQLEHEEIREYRATEFTREQRPYMIPSTPPSRLTGELAMMYQFGLYPRTRNRDYGRRYGWTVIDRAWKMAHYRVEMIRCIDVEGTDGVAPGDLYLVRSQRQGSKRYLVRLSSNYCSCPYRKKSGRRPCKHIILVAYLDYMLRGRPLPVGLMLSQGMDKGMSRALGSVCDSIGRPLKNVRSFRQEMARRLSQILGRDSCLYTGWEITRDVFNGNVRTGIMVMSNLFGPTDNQKAVTIRFMARPMMGLIRADRSSRVWRVPVVETRAPGFSRKKLSIDASATVSQRFRYHVVELTESSGATCTCRKYNGYSLICEHIRAAVLADMVEPSSRMDPQMAASWAVSLSEWAAGMNFGIERELVPAEDEGYRLSSSSRNWYNPSWVGGSYLTNERLDAQIYDEPGDGAMSATFIGNYYSGTVIGGFGRGKEQDKKKRVESPENMVSVDVSQPTQGPPPIPLEPATPPTQYVTDLDVEYTSMETFD